MTTRTAAASFRARGTSWDWRRCYENSPGIVDGFAGCSPARRPLDARAFDLFRSDEATIADIHAAFKAKTLTCRVLAQLYLDRIEAYDKKGPALNAIVVTNPDALDSRRRTSPTPPPDSAMPSRGRDGLLARRRGVLAR